MSKQYAYFGELPLRAEFSAGGNRWIKRSSRTAEIVLPVEHAGWWFYFGQRHVTIVGAYSRLEA